MSREGKFLVYCLEIYRAVKKLTGKQVVELFKRYEVFDYVIGCYDALHTTGGNYIIEDIDLFIEAQIEILNRKSL